MYIPKLLFVYALTPLHAGAGRSSLGSPVDLPIQRDEFGFPVIWSSGIKGVLRSSFELKARSDVSKEDRVAYETFTRLVFGPKPKGGEESEYSASISVLDARLLMIPVRSLKGVWAYLTSPHLLRYYEVYLEVASKYGAQLNGKLKKLSSLINKIEEYFRNRGLDADRTALVSGDECLIESMAKGVKGYAVVLNEEEFSAELGFRDELNVFWQEFLPAEIEGKSLVVVSDNVAGQLVRKSLLIQPRVRLEYSRKTVSPGGLWEEEYLPQRTLMVSLVIARQPRQSSENVANRVAKNLVGDANKAGEIAKNALSKYGFDKLNANKVLDELSKQGYAILGGKETVGKGIVRLFWV